MEKKKIFMLALLLLLLLALVFEFFVFIVRAVSEKQLDDVSPGIPCEQELLDKSDVFFIIPKFANESIGDYKEWCEKILNSGKKLEMHGVYHTYREFMTKKNESYLDEGIIEFNKCFGEKPAGFKAPQVALSGENKAMIEKKGLYIYDYWNQLTHKVYHCNDSGKYPNWLMRII
jgi:predicted deacetylase